MRTKNVRYPFLLTLLLLLVISGASQSAPETHLYEAGSGVIFQRSAFAHGYRHGYEDGYHLGNIDVNMARQPRTKLSEFRGTSSRYSPEFGAKKSFETGYQDGLIAGYSDGFAGRKFRAIEGLRTVASALNQAPAPADASNTYFDNGFANGYHDGRNRGGNGFSDTRQLDPTTGGCGHVPSSAPESVSAQEMFCDGFRRGYLLGQSDALAGSPYPALAARK